MHIKNAAIQQNIIIKQITQSASTSRFDSMIEKQIEDSIDQPPEKKRENHDDLSRAIGYVARVRVRVSIHNFHGDFIVWGNSGQIARIDWRFDSRKGGNLI